MEQKLELVIKCRDCTCSNRKSASSRVNCPCRHVGQKEGAVVDLCNGDLLAMLGDCQKEYHHRNERINRVLEFV